MSSLDQCIYILIPLQCNNATTTEDRLQLDCPLRGPLGGWAANTNLSDGAWHHLALTTWPDGSRGYRMYVDGKMAAVLPSDTLLWGKEG